MWKIDNPVAQDVYLGVVVDQKRSFQNNACVAENRLIDNQEAIVVGLLTSQWSYNPDSYGSYYVYETGYEGNFWMCFRNMAKGSYILNQYMGN